MTTAADTMTTPIDHVTIRTAGPRDAALIDTMVREIAAPEDCLDDVISDAEGWKQLLARPDVRVLIAEVEGNNLGYARTTRRINLWLGTDVISLDDLWVRPHARNRGVGAQLMAEVARLARNSQRW